MKKTQSVIESTASSMFDRSRHNLKMAVLDFIISKLLKDNLMIGELQVEETRALVREELLSKVDEFFFTLIEETKSE